jgi:hypothetical protein
VFCSVKDGDCLVDQGIHIPEFRWAGPSSICREPRHTLTAAPLSDAQQIARQRSHSSSSISIVFCISRYSEQRAPLVIWQAGVSGITSCNRMIAT